MPNTTPPYYSLYQRRTDGQLAGPRFLLHLVKLATHAALAFLVGCVLHLVWRADPTAILAGAIAGGPGVYVAVCVRQLYFDWRDHVPVNWWDKLHDAAFPLATLAGGLLYVGAVTLGLACLAIAILLWLTLHRRAEP